MRQRSGDQSPRAAVDGAGALADPAALAEMRAQLARAAVSFDDDELAVALPIALRRIAGLRRLAEGLTPTDAPATDVLRDDLR